MSESRLSRLMKARPFVSLCMATALAIPALADTKVKIASVLPEYSPMAGQQRGEPVSMQSFTFEVDQETGRARIVIEYSYPSRPALGIDGGAGPAPTMAQVPGLRYDVASKSVIYDNAGSRTVCAKVRDRKVLFWNTSSVVPTGACKVSAEVVTKAHDTGWKIQHVSSIDTFLEVD